MATMATETKPSSSTPEPGAAEPASPGAGSPGPSRAIPARAGKAAPNSWGLGDGQAIPWEYAPAPESSRDRRRSASATACSSTAGKCPASDGATFTTLDPATEEPLAEVARATDADVDRGGRGRSTRARRSLGQAARSRAGQVPLPDRPASCRSAAASSPSSRRWTPASRSRSRATSTCRSRRRTSGTTRAGRTSSSTPSRAGSRGRSASPPRSSRGTSRCSCWPGRSRPALAAGNTVVLKPASTTPADARSCSPTCAARRTCRRASSTSSPGRARSAWPWSRHPDVDKVAFTGSTASARRSPSGDRRHGQGADAGARRQGRQHRVRRRAARPGRRGHRQRHLLQPGRGVLRRAAGCSSRSRSPTCSIDQAQGPPGDAPGRRPARQEHRCRRDQQPRPSWTRSPSSWRPAWRRAPSCTSRPASCPSAGYFFRPTLFTNVAQSHRIAQEEIFGPVLSTLTFRTPDEAIEKANNTRLRPVRRGLDREGRRNPR